MEQLNAFTEKFGKVALRNKMIDMEQWGEALAIQEQTPHVSIDLILIQREYLKPAQAQAILSALAKQGLTKEGEKTAPSSQPPPKSPEKIQESPPSSQPPPKKPEKIQEPPSSLPSPLQELPPKGSSSPSSVSGVPKTSRPANSAGEIEKLLRKAYEMEASDFHLKVGSPPLVRQYGQLKKLELPEMTSQTNEKLLFSLLTPHQEKRLQEEKQLDFCYEISKVARFRANIYKHQRGYDGSFRVIPTRIRNITELGLPESILRLSHYNQGLALFTGPAGCGKSCTMAAIVDEVNGHRKDNVITLEDPIEFVFESKGCNVFQREVLSHTKSFSNALRAALREDPDVIMIGELRDLETVSLAITASETGHLVLGSLHTTSASRTIGRILDVFPPKQQAQIRSMVSEALRGVVSQQLIPRADKKGVVVAYEILFITSAISNLIREAKTFQIPSIIQTGKKLGMRLMDDSLLELLQKGLITKEEAMHGSDNPNRFKTPS